MSGRPSDEPGAPDALPGWLAGARPPVPPELGPWLGPAADDADRRPPPPVLADRGIAELTRVMADEAGGDPADRGRAFHLLAADAWLTWAAEAALDAPEASELLTTLARRVGGTGGEGGPGERSEAADGATGG